MILASQIKNGSLQNQVELTRKAAEQAGLVISIKKIKTIVFRDRNIEHELQIAGESIEKIEEFECLGSLPTRNNNCLEEIERRVDKATGVMASPKHT